MDRPQKSPACAGDECPTTPIRRRGRAVAVAVVVALFALLVACSLTGCGQRHGEEAVEEPATEAPQELTAKELDDYTWDELSEISARIAAAESDEAAASVAQEFGILNQDGTVADQIRRFLLADGTVCEVRVVGIRHDTKADGSGAAGLTFLCAEVPAQSVYNDSNTVEGGWEGSTLRSWLASDMKAQLPEDLQALVVPVIKVSNNTGSLRDPSAVTQTTDELWVPSAREVLGDVDWYTTEYKDSAADFDTVLNAEGTQYQWFAQQGVTSTGSGDGALARTYKGAATGWWLRSVVPSSQLFSADPFAYYVMDSGYPEGQAAPTATEGVLFGFCL